MRPTSFQSVLKSLTSADSDRSSTHVLGALRATLSRGSHCPGCRSVSGAAESVDEG